MAFLHEVLDATAVADAKRPLVTIDRLELMARRDRGDPLDFGLFGSSQVSTSSLQESAFSAAVAASVEADDADSSAPRSAAASSESVTESSSASASSASAALAAAATGGLFLNHFGHTFQQLRFADRFALRPPRPHGAEPFYAFTVEFRNELVVGEAGPWRQLFADISSELQQGDCPILVPCPNRDAKTGENREKFVMRSGAVNLPLCEMLGLLMGCCIRTGVRLNLDLPPFVWKPLVGEPLTRADLAAVDFATVELLKFVENPTLDQDTFESAFDENFRFVFAVGCLLSVTLPE